LFRFFGVAFFVFCLLPLLLRCVLACVRACLLRPDWYRILHKRGTKSHAWVFLSSLLGVLPSPLPSPLPSLSLPFCLPASLRGSPLAPLFVLMTGPPFIPPPPPHISPRFALFSRSIPPAAPALSQSVALSMCCVCSSAKLLRFVMGTISSSKAIVRRLARSRRSSVVRLV
jgi:hypothetical protein